jgi:hypothetical protein
MAGNPDTSLPITTHSAPFLAGVAYLLSVGMGDLAVLNLKALFGPGKNCAL